MRTDIAWHKVTLAWEKILLPIKLPRDRKIYARLKRQRTPTFLSLSLTHAHNFHLHTRSTAPRTHIDLCARTERAWAIERLPEDTAWFIARVNPDFSGLKRERKNGNCARSRVIEYSFRVCTRPVKRARASFSSDSSSFVSRSRRVGFDAV